MGIDWQVAGPWLVVAVLGYFVVRAARRGELAADALQRENDAQERYIRALLSWGWSLGMIARAHCPDTVVLPLPPIPPNGKSDGAGMSRSERARVRETLVERLSMDELRDLSFDLGMSYEGQNTPAALARTLVEHINRHHLLDLARERLGQTRPDVRL